MNNRIIDIINTNFSEIIDSFTEGEAFQLLLDLKPLINKFDYADIDKIKTTYKKVNKMLEVILLGNEQIMKKFLDFYKKFKFDRYNKLFNTSNSLYSSSDGIPDNNNRNNNRCPSNSDPIKKFRESLFRVFSDNENLINQFKDWEKIKKIIPRGDLSRCRCFVDVYYEISKRGNFEIFLEFLQSINHRSVDELKSTLGHMRQLAQCCKECDEFII